MNVEKTEFISRLTTSVVPLQSQSRSTINKHSIGGKDGTAISTNVTVKGADDKSSDKIELTKLHWTKLHWTSLYGKGEEDSYHFFAAYYDGRASVPDRPVVIVLGYVRRNVAAIKLYCLFKFTNGSEICLKQPAEEKNLHCHIRNAAPRQYFCKIRNTEEPPISIRMSTKSSCKLVSNSGEIPVQNRLSGANVKVKKFGVCVEGPVVQKDYTTLQKLVQFIEMNRVLGAEVIYFYINLMQMRSDDLRYILEHYSDIVRVIEWKKFNKWVPLYYYGQLLIMNDCLLRNMYEIEHLVINDLDEIILPVEHDNWTEMLNFNGSWRYASYTFQNRFLVENTRPSTPLQLSNNCTAGLQVPMYFTRRTVHPCNKFTGYRAKFIVKPRIALLPSVHGMCTSIGGYITAYNAPAHLGINAHYRDHIPWVCPKRTGNFQVNVAMKFASRVIRNMCAH